MSYEGSALRCHTPQLPTSSEPTPTMTSSDTTLSERFRDVTSSLVAARRIRRPRAYRDEVLIQPKVLFNATATEDRYLPSASYFSCVQTEVEPYMRKILVTWMFEVCEELRRRKDVFLLAVNYLDRFLSTINVPKCRLQLLGASCMLLASKFKEAHPVSSEILCIYTDNSVKIRDLLSWELLVANILSWDLAAPTSCYILDMLTQLHPLLRCLRDKGNLVQVITSSAQQFIEKCALEITLAAQPPSMMASACLYISYIMHCQQIFPTFGDSILFTFLNGITALTGIESDVLKNLVRIIHQYLEDVYNIRGEQTIKNFCTSTESCHQNKSQEQCTIQCKPSVQRFQKNTDHDYHKILDPIDQSNHNQNNYLKSSSSNSNAMPRQYIQAPQKIDPTASYYRGGIADKDYYNGVNLELRKLEEIYPTPPPLERNYKNEFSSLASDELIDNNSYGGHAVQATNQPTYF